MLFSGGVIAIVALSDEPDSDGTDDRPVVDQEVVAQEYESVQELRDAVRAAGYDCDAFEVIAEPAGALERANCTSSTTLGIYSDGAEAQASVETLQALLDGLGGRSVHLMGRP